MEILERIRQLIDERGWTNYRLTEEAQLNNSTLQHMFERGTMPSISTLTAICGAFGITLSQFFCEDDGSVILSDEERRLVQTFRKLNQRDRNIIARVLEELDR